MTEEKPCIKCGQYDGPLGQEPHTFWRTADLYHIEPGMYHDTCFWEIVNEQLWLGVRKGIDVILGQNIEDHIELERHPDGYIKVTVKDVGSFKLTAVAAEAFSENLRAKVREPA